MNFLSLLGLGSGGSGKTQSSATAISGIWETDDAGNKRMVPEILASVVVIGVALVVLVIAALLLKQK